MYNILTLWIQFIFLYQNQQSVKILIKNTLIYHGAEE